MFMSYEMYILRYRLKSVFNKYFTINSSFFIVLLLLYILNIVVQFSASNGNINHIISDILYLSLSIIVFIIFHNINFNYLKLISVPLYILSILLLIFSLMNGVSVNGARRWIHVLSFTIQPSEIANLALLLLLSFYLSKDDNFMIESVKLIVSAILLLIPVYLVLKQPDLGTAITISISGFLVIYFAKLPNKVLLILVLSMVIVSPLIWQHLHAYQRLRLTTLFNPSLDPLGHGYHINQSIIAIGSGGFFGKGFLHGTQTHLNFIPEKSTDFIVSLLSEEFGFLGVIILLLFYLFIIKLSINIVSTNDNKFNQILGMSIITSFIISVFINMGMVAGIVPIVGIPLPLMSYGGTNTMMTMIKLGIISSIDRQNKYS